MRARGGGGGSGGGGGGGQGRLLLDRPQDDVLEKGRPLPGDEARGPQGRRDLRRLVPQEGRARRGRRGSISSRGHACSSPFSFPWDPSAVSPGDCPGDDLGPQRLCVGFGNRGEREATPTTLAAVSRGRGGRGAARGGRNSSGGSGSSGRPRPRVRARARRRGDEEEEGLKAPESDLGRGPLVPGPGGARAPPVGGGPDGGAVGDGAGLFCFVFLRSEREGTRCVVRKRRAARRNAESHPTLSLSLLSLLVFFSSSSSSSSLFLYLELWPDGACMIEGVEDRALEVVRHSSVLRREKDSFRSFFLWSEEKSEKLGPMRTISRSSAARRREKKGAPPHLSRSFLVHSFLSVGKKVGPARRARRALRFERDERVNALGPRAREAWTRVSLSIDCCSLFVHGAFDKQGNGVAFSPLSLLS